MMMNTDSHTWRKRDVAYSFGIYAIFLFVLLLFEPFLRRLISSLSNPHVYVLVEEVLNASILIGVTLTIVRRKYGYNVDSIGLMAKDAFRSIFLGLISGFTLWVLSLLLDKLVFIVFGSNALFEHTYAQLAATSNSLVDFFIVFWGVCLVGPLTEEIYFRGFVYTVFRNHYSLVVSCLMSGVFFAVVHINPLWMIQSLIVGIAFCLLYEKTGSLLSPIVAHGIINLLTLCRQML